MQAAEEFDGLKEDKAIGTEINAQIGYQLYDNLSISLAGAYCFVGDGLSGDATERLVNVPASDKTSTLKQFGATDADDPYMVVLQASYTF
jgi:hypothetical protein